jgi:hypothetical protein
LNTSCDKLWQTNLSWFVRLAYRNSDNKAIAVGHIVEPDKWFVLPDVSAERLDPQPISNFSRTFGAINCVITKVSIATKLGALRISVDLNPCQENRKQLKFLCDVSTQDLGAAIENLMTGIGGVYDSHKLEGRFVRVRHNLGLGPEIGHIINNVWMDAAGKIAPANI